MPLAPSNSVSHPSRKRRKVSLPLIGGAFLSLLAVVAIDDNQFDIKGRVLRASKNRPHAIQHEIGAYGDRAFIEGQLLKNSTYYAGKKIANEFDNFSLTNSLTRLDIAIRLFQEGKLSEHDMLNYIVGSSEKIVTDIDVVMDLKVSIDGGDFRGVTSNDLSRDSNVLMDFIDDLIQDRNNPLVRVYNLQITPREGGGGYILSFTTKNKQAVLLHVAFRLKPKIQTYQ